MRFDRTSKLRFRLGVFLSVMVAVVVWWWLGGLSTHAVWLKVEAPRQAVVGRPLPIRVHLAPMAKSARVSVDLHWATTRDVTEGFLATGGTKEVGSPGGSFDFAVPVQPANRLRFVYGIIYLSPTGNWQDHTLAAATGVIPVDRNPSQSQESKLEPLPVWALGDQEMDHPQPSPLPRLVTALLLLASLLLAWGDRSGQHGQYFWRRALLTALALASLWELLGLEHWLGVQARTFARAEDLYYPRIVFQKTMISVVAAGTAGLLALVRRAHRSRRCLLVSLILFFGISAVNLLSLHAIDKIADLSWHGFALVQALKLACAIMILQGVRGACRAPA